MEIRVYTDTPNVSVELEVDGEPYILRMHGGEWQVVHNGGVVRVWSGRIDWVSALGRALIMLTTEHVNS